MVYPSPAGASVTVTNASGKIMVFNASGKQVLTQKSDGTKMKIDVRSLPSGVYFIKDSSGNGRRFIKD
jgi:hypothetical protein